MVLLAGAGGDAVGWYRDVEPLARTRWIVLGGPAGLLAAGWGTASPAGWSTARRPRTG